MKDIIEKHAEMVYGDGCACTPSERGKCTCLAEGTYKGLRFVVLNVYGMHPCGYVNVAGTKFEHLPYTHEDLYPIDVHGGFTYGKDHLEGFEGGWWLGWDYGHWGDRCEWGPLVSNHYLDGEEYTTNDVIEDCKSVIRQLRKQEKAK